MELHGGLHGVCDNVGHRALIISTHSDKIQKPFQASYWLQQTADQPIEDRLFDRG